MIEEDIHMYKDGLGRLDVAHEDMTYHMFLNIIDNIAIMWYASLLERSINSWT